MGSRTSPDLKRKILDSRLSISELVSTAWAAAASFRATDKRDPGTMLPWEAVDMLQDAATSGSWMSYRYVMRPVALLFLTLFAVAVVAQPVPEVRAFAFAQETVDPGLPFVVRAWVISTLPTEAKDVVFTIEIDGVTGWGRLDERCVANGLQVRCELGIIAARQTTGSGTVIAFELEAIAVDDPSGRDLLIATAVSHRDGPTYKRGESQRMYRTFYVTTTADSGAGSLRDVIAATSAAGCTWSLRCKVAFRIAGANAQWLTLRPESPLPMVREVAIDGRIQTRFFGDTNPDGPEIEISGERSPRGTAGLQLSGWLFGVALNGFTGPGIAVLPGGALIESNFIGVDPTGTLAVPNERGVVVDHPGGTMRLQNNVISGNRRAGVFAYAARNVDIHSNRIGSNAKGTAGVPNGASGVFLGPGVEGGYVNSNSIAFNMHAGIAVAGGVRLVEMKQNSLHANAGLGIDYGLDGVSPVVEAPDKYFASPRITSARYDPMTDTTVIEGFQPGPRDGYAMRTITLYANDAPDETGFGEGQYVLGDFLFATFSSPDDPPFRFTMKGRPPGPWISATVTVGLHYYWSRTPAAEGDNQGLLTTTTEFGRTVWVEGF